MELSIQIQAPGLNPSAWCDGNHIAMTPGVQSGPLPSRNPTALPRDAYAKYVCKQSGRRCILCFGRLATSGIGFHAIIC